MSVKDIADEFGYIDLKSWIAKVNRDLREGNIDDYSHLIGDIKMPLMLHPDSLVKPIHINKRSKTLLGGNFDLTKAENHNEMLLSSLEFGLNSPGLIGDKPESVMWKDILKDIELTMLTLLVDMPTPLALETWIEYVNHHFHEGKSQIFYKLNHVLFTTINKSGNALNKFDNILLCHNEIRDSSDLSHIAGKLDLLISGLIKEGTTPSHIGVSVGLNTNYLQQVSALRAMRIIGMNMVQTFDPSGKTKFFLDVNIQYKASSEISSQIIACTIMTMAAMTAGVDRISITLSDPLERFDERSRRRIAQNIFHILEMESGFLNVNDMAAGAFYFDKLTNELASNAWEQFIIKQGKPVS